VLCFHGPHAFLSVWIRVGSCGWPKMLDRRGDWRMEAKLTGGTSLPVAEREGEEGSTWQ